MWKINTIEDLYQCIACNEKVLNTALAKKENYYKNKIQIPKKKGMRTICSVDKTSALFSIQRELKKNYLDNIMISDAAYGFVKDTDYIDYLAVHKNFTGNNRYLRIDISDFFGSITEEQVKEALRHFVADGDDGEKILTRLIDIIMNHGKLEQGTPVAPVVSNIVFRPVDIRIERYCEKQNVTYSRYADDLLFSSESDAVIDRKFVRTVERILEDYNFKVNYDKLRKARNRIALNGYVVDSDVRLSRKKRKPIGAMLFFLENNKFSKTKEWFEHFNDEMQKYGISSIANVNDLINLLAGNRSFLINSFKHSESDRYCKQCKKMIGRIEKQIHEITKEVE